jgi:2-polyprenyl-3-methyl-5-hydroxy-6-metoxy-1,4-benzoquinol methylase
VSTDSTDSAYAERLRRIQLPWWKRMLDVQRPYRVHLRKLDLGFVLDVGCGIGRNLENLGAGKGVGVDPNRDAIATCRERGFIAMTPEELAASEYGAPGRFDAMLMSHVLEHLQEADAIALIQYYLPYVRSGGHAVFMTPQEVGYRSDPTHVAFLDVPKLEALVHKAGVSPQRGYSFPFPRWMGRVFKYNEFVVVAQKP